MTAPAFPMPLEITHTPTTTWVETSLTKHPPALTAALTDYRSTHDHWHEEYNKLGRMAGEPDKVAAQVAEDLRLAVASGQTPQADTRVAEAVHAATVQVEVVKQAREAATASTDRLNVAYREAGDDLVDPFLAVIDAALNDYDAAVLEGERTVKQAYTRLAEAMANAEVLIGEHVLETYGARELISQQGVGVGTVLWPPRPTLQTRQRIAQCKELVERGRNRVVVKPTREQSF